MTARLAFLFCLLVALPAAAQTTTYHAFGDSITYGTGSSTPYPNTIASDKGVTLTNYAIIGLESGGINIQEIFANENPGASGNPIYTLLAGTNDANNGNPEATYINNLESGVSWLGVPSTSKVPATSCSSTGSWGPAGGGSFPPAPPGSLSSSDSAGSLTCSISVNNGVLYGWYTGNSGVTYSVDGGSPVAAPVTVGNASINVIRIMGLASGTHTLTINNSTSSPFVIVVIGIGTPSTTPSCCRVLMGGVLRQQNDANAAATAAYNADAQTAYSVMLSDGLNVAFIPVRNYVNDTTDMSDMLHPNTMGALQLAVAFEAQWDAPSAAGGMSFGQRLHR